MDRGWRQPKPPRVTSSSFEEDIMITAAAHLPGALLLGIGLMLVGCSAEDAGTPQGEPVTTTAPPPAPTPSPGASNPPPGTPADAVPTTPADSPPIRPPDDPPPAQAEDPAPHAVVSPLRIPLPTDELMGRGYASGLEDLQRGIAFACGGTSCVTVIKVGESLQLEPGQTCDTVRRVQGAGRDPDTHLPFVDTPVGGTIVVVVNVRCEDAPAEDPAPGPPPVDDPDPAETSAGEAPPPAPPADDPSTQERPGDGTAPEVPAPPASDEPAPESVDPGIVP